MANEFLSDEWFDAAEALNAESGEPPATIKDLVINVTVTGAPQGDVDLHLAAGRPARGHADGAPTTLTTDYDVAKQMFVEGSQSAGMAAFMSGKIKIGGDMTKLMVLQSAMSTPQEQERIKKLGELTE